MLQDKSCVNLIKERSPQILSSNWPVEIKTSKWYRLITIESRHRCQDVFYEMSVLLIADHRSEQLSTLSTPDRPFTQILKKLSRFKVAAGIIHSPPPPPPLEVPEIRCTQRFPSMNICLDRLSTQHPAPSTQHPACWKLVFFLVKYDLNIYFSLVFRVKKRR